MLFVEFRILTTKMMKLVFDFQPFVIFVQTQRDLLLQLNASLFHHAKVLLINDQMVSGMFALEMKKLFYHKKKSWINQNTLLQLSDQP